MATRVFLHIGLPKTGTTFLQTTMWHNRRKLRGQGFLYPGSKRMDHYHASQVVRGTPPASLGADATAWDDLVGEVSDWHGNSLISHEFFSMTTPQQAQDAVRRLAPAEVRVVLTVRDYQRQFPAVWQEALKMNSDLSFDAFMDQVLTLPDARRKGGSGGRRTKAWGWGSQDIPAVLDRWGTAVDPDHLHVITVPPPGAPRHLLWERWCSVLGIDDSRFDMDVTYANESLGAAQAALLWRVKPYLTGVNNDGPVRHQWVRKYFGHEVLVPQGGDRFAPRPHHAAVLRTLSQEAADTITKRGYAVTGDVADLVPTEPPPVGPHPDDVSEQEVLEVAARAIDQMIHDVRSLTEERDAWRSRARRRARRLARGRPLRTVVDRTRRALRR